MLRLESATAVILAGGLGTRLRSVVADRPKVLAPVQGRPFLTYLFDQLAEIDIKYIVLCTGYMGEQIQNVFGNAYGSSLKRLKEIKRKYDPNNLFRMNQNVSPQ